ncbi:MAG: hypothetical protein WCK02_17455 [Bacteroidota bacterium]
MQLVFDIEKMEQTNKALADKVQTDNKLQFYFLYLIVSILLLLLGLFSVLYYKQKIKKKEIEVNLYKTKFEQKQLEKIIEFKKKELEDLFFYIMHKNELLEQIKLDVKGLNKNSGEEQPQKIKQIEYKIKQSVRKDKDLEKLSNNIDKVHSEFIDSLTAKFPDLTEKEKRLCVLLKLNFSSKEIASLNNISENAIIKARHRMRRKMGLFTDENLSEIIQAI